ncbi:hypothetical protein [Spiroplasma alleghenense]|uniref:Uncharacterized protein n=1 Tax=Spiroplasma alleghenense TaxID=216931 RepID=A0A345Z3P2_9MOLU|nr:hypothetical protein [Spiroplasma alleghenense]AXK51221.1 hypothetical protein SALLE_v1c05470 [Spiroplasma alleghenense]
MESNLDSLDKKYNLLIKRFKEYDEVNLKLSRYPIFNYYYHTNFRDKNLVYIEICEGEVGQDKKVLNETNNDDALIIDLNKNDEVIWGIYTSKCLIKRSESNLKKAKEFSKPDAGLMTYNPILDAYVPNAKIESILQLNKDFQNEIYLTKVDILAIIYFLKNFVRSKTFDEEVQEISNAEIIKLAKIITNRFEKNFELLYRVEGVPRWDVNLTEKEKDLFVLNCNEKMITASNNNGDQVQMSNVIEAHLEHREEVLNLYNHLRNYEECNIVILEFTKKLIVRNEFPFYYQNEKTKEWWLTKLGEKILEDFNLLDFLNFETVNDLLSMDIN